MKIPFGNKHRDIDIKIVCERDRNYLVWSSKQKKH